MGIRCARYGCGCGCGLDSDSLGEEILEILRVELRLSERVGDGGDGDADGDGEEGVAGEDDEDDDDEESLLVVLQLLVVLLLLLLLLLLVVLVLLSARSCEGESSDGFSDRGSCREHFSQPGGHLKSQGPDRGLLFKVPALDSDVFDASV